MRNSSVPESIEQFRSTLVEISEPGYYRIGKGVNTVTCMSDKFTIVEWGAITSLIRGNIYAPNSQIEQWIEVTKNMLKSGRLQFEISCIEGAQDDRLLLRDEAKESEVREAIAKAIAKARAAISSRAAGVGRGSTSRTRPRPRQGV